MGMKKNETQESSSTHNPNTTNHFSTTNHSNTTKHFSHQHPLKLIQQSPNSPLPSSCGGCHWPSNIDNLIYICTVCPFYLHKSCFDMPTSLTHRSHKTHPFTLVAKPVYPSGIMVCDACGGQGSSLSYHCRPCGIDLHLRCAIIPLSTVHSYHEHKLDLAFESPYGEMDYTCGICKMSGNKQWLYRCTSCRLDVHVKCAYEHNITTDVSDFNQHQPQPQPQNLTSFMTNFNQPRPQPQNLTSFMTNLNQPPSPQQNITNYVNNLYQPSSQTQQHTYNLNYQLPSYLQNLTSYYMNSRNLNQNEKTSTGSTDVGGSGLRLESGNVELKRVAEIERSNNGKTSHA